LMHSCSKLFSCCWHPAQSDQLSTKLETLESRPYAEVLKSKDVQDADERALLGEGALDRVVDLLHKPTEQPVVEGLGQRVSSVRGLLGTPMSVNT
jgi:hypothetical protein